MSFAVIIGLRIGLFVSAVGSGFKNFRREGNFKKIVFLSVAKVKALPANLGSWVGIERFAGCAYTCVMAIFLC